MFELFILKAVIAAIGIVLIASVLSCFVVAKSMAYFGDSLSHSALLGIVLGIVVGIDSSLGIIIVSFGFSILLLYLQQKKIFSSDTLLGILAHLYLSLGVVFMSLIGAQFDLHAYFFGNILTVGVEQLYVLYLGGSVVLLLLFINWQPLLLMTISEDLAQSDGINVFSMNLLFVFLMTVVVAVSVQIVGIILITSMLIIPAASARLISRSPEAMVVWAIALGIFAVLIGMGASIKFDVPSGPAIVVALAGLFMILFAIQSVRKNKITI